MSYFRLPSRGNRFYADLSKYGGPTLKALIPDGERRATQDEDVARELYHRWTKYYQDHRRRRHLGISQNVTLGEYARRYIEERAALRDGIKPRTLEGYAAMLDNVILPFFGRGTPLGAITADRVREYILHRRRQPGYRGQPISWGTIQRELSVLSNLFERAIRADLVFENPVRKHGWVEYERTEPLFLEPSEAWALLQAAAEDSDPGAEALIAVFLYGGLRQVEAIGLQACDVDRENRVMIVRDNEHRSYREGGIKHRSSLREVPLWPELEERLPARIGRALLIPSPRDPDRIRSTSMWRMLKRLTKAAGIEKHVTPHTLRHTWCAMRLQTLDGGAPVAPFTVMKEGGWSSLRMVERIYGHLPKQRLRLNELSYRPQVIQRAASN